jgi:hypothetical protein
MKQFMGHSDSLNGILYQLQFIHCLRGLFNLQMLHIPALEIIYILPQCPQTFPSLSGHYSLRSLRQFISLVDKPIPSNCLPSYQVAQDEHLQMLCLHVATPHMYTWSRFRGVSVGYSRFLRYTGHPPPGRLRTSFFLDTRLQSCSLAPLPLVLLLPPLVAPLFLILSLVIVLSCPLPFLFIYSI